MTVPPRQCFQFGIPGSASAEVLRYSSSRIKIVLVIGAVDDVENTHQRRRQWSFFVKTAVDKKTFFSTNSLSRGGEKFFC